LWGEVYWPIRDPKKVRPKNCILRRRFIKLDSRLFIVLLRGKSEGGTNERYDRSYRTEHGSFSDCFHMTTEPKLDFIRQQTNVSAFLFKHGPLWARYHPRENSTSSYLCPFIGPVPTSTTKVPSSTARALLLVAIGDYGLLFTSGVHRLLGPCEGRRSWRRPNDTQSATSS
jgi:hypothetical protein